MSAFLIGVAFGTAVLEFICGLAVAGLFCALGVCLALWVVLQGQKLAVWMRHR